MVTGGRGHNYLGLNRRKRVLMTIHAGDARGDRRATAVVSTDGLKSSYCLGHDD